MECSIEKLFPDIRNLIGCNLLRHTFLEPIATDATHCFKIQQSRYNTPYLEVIILCFWIFQTTLQIWETASISNSLLLPYTKSLQICSISDLRK
jgi:tryptophan-rich sensory protein